MTLTCQQTTSAGNSLGVMWKTVSEDCNLACDYCYYSRIGGKIEGAVRRINHRVLDKFVREYMDLSNGSASFAWQGGEPLLAGLDFFEEIVSLQAKYAPPHTVITNSIQTNATLVTKQWASFFRRYRFLVGISVDGPSDIHDAHRVTRNGSGTFERVMAGVSLLQEADVDLNVLTVIHPDNAERARDLMAFYHEQEFTHVQFIPAMDFRAQEVDKPPTYLITPEQYGRFLCDAFDEWYGDGHPTLSVRFFDNMLNLYLHGEAELCIHKPVCPTTLVLEQNGDAYPCDFYIDSRFRVGNVGVDSLETILGNLVYTNFLSMKPRLPGKCSSCQYLRLCHGGCPRNRPWTDVEAPPDVDYFCNSYLTFYTYAHERIQALADGIKVERLQIYLDDGGQPPGRNDPCMCGSGQKYKKCCEPLRWKQKMAKVT